jgi:cell division protein FtsW
MHVQRKLYFDSWLVLSAISLLALGFITVTSASIPIAERFKLASYYFPLHQAMGLVIGALCFWLVTYVPLKVWQRFSVSILLASILFLGVLLIPGVSREINGSVRWIHLGPISIQVSEFAKLGVIIYMASYLTRRELEVRTRISGFLKPMFILGVICMLLLLEPDFGAAVVIIVTVMGMLFLGGVPFKRFAILFLLVLSVIGIVSFTSPYRLARLTAFLDPWADQFNTGYQLTQSLIAFGRGGWFGTGLGGSVQKLLYLPEPHTDFLFAVLAEELGLFGGLMVLILFTILLAKAFTIGRKNIVLNQKFAGFMAYGIALWLGSQAMINIGVNIGVLPTKGLTLPLMSYGGCSIIVGMIALGLLLRIDFEARLPGNR